MGIYMAWGYRGGLLGFWTTADSQDSSSQTSTIFKMKYLALIASALGLVAASVIPPLEQRDVQTVHLKFRAGPAEYDMAFPADGVERLTSPSPSPACIAFS